MSEDLNEQIVVAFFADADAADGAAASLQAWDEANDDIKLGALGRLVVSDGKLEAKRYGAGRTTRGALVGGALGVLAAGVTGGLSLLAGALGGGLVGGVTGKLTAGSFGISDDTAEKLKQHLQDSGAALVVHCDHAELSPTMHELKRLGGTVFSLGVSEKVLNAVHQAQVDAWEEDMFRTNFEAGGVL